MKVKSYLTFDLADINGVGKIIEAPVTQYNSTAPCKIITQLNQCLSKTVSAKNAGFIAELRYKTNLYEVYLYQVYFSAVWRNTFRPKKGRCNPGS